MKFGKVLKVSSENMPAEMHDLFLRYKELKKQIKMIPVSKDIAAGEKQASVSPDGSATGSGSTGAAITATVLSPEEQAFIATLNEDLARFNRYFIEKEEEAVIRIQALCDDLAAAAAAAGLHLPPALTNAATVLSENENETTCLHSPHATALQAAVAAVAASGPLPATVSTQQKHDKTAQSRQPQPPQETAPHWGGTAAPVRMDVETIRPDASKAARPAGQGTASPSDQDQQQQRQPGSQPSQHRSHDRHYHHTHNSLPPGTSSSSSPHFTALQEVKSRLVQFHGEMVLLLHWSLLNYAAVVKILKKHDKRTGVLLRAPYLANVLQQPFSSTTIMSRLAKRAEELVVATTQLSPAGAGGARLESAAAAAAATATAGPSADKSSVPSDVSSVQCAHGTVATVGPTAAPSGHGATTASDASTLTFAADREGGFGDVSGHPEPLVGSTMHALETWANLRKNAITPSTVLVAAAEQPLPQQQPPQQLNAAKRKAEGTAQATDAGGGVLGSEASKIPRQDDEKNNHKDAE